MSDNLRRYRAIRQALDTLAPQPPQGNVARHLNTLAALINGIVGSKSTQLPAIAGKVVDGSHPDSRVKKYTRWLQNDRIEAGTYFLPYVTTLLATVSQHTLAFAIDGSVVGRGCLCLMISLLYKKRALPLCWRVVPHPKGHVSEALHRALLAAVYPLIPAEAQVIVVGDGEFDGAQWLAQLTQQHWQYVCRTAQDTLLIDEGDTFLFGHVACAPGERYFSLPGVYFTTQHYGPVHAVVYWDRRYPEPLYLLTNLEVAEEAYYWYHKRAQIETFFSDQKSRGFNLQKSHLSDPSRLERLLIAAALAYLWLMYLGALVSTNGWQSLIHRADRCDLSLFQLGFRFLDYVLNQILPIPVAFCVIIDDYSLY